MSRRNTLQNFFLEKICTEKMAVSLFLLTGIRMQGYIAAYDGRVLIVKSTISQMVYRDAVASIVPSELILCPVSADA